MINNNSFYKSEDILNNNSRVRMKGFFDPYEYNFESNYKDRLNSDEILQKSKNHTDRNIKSK